MNKPSIIGKLHVEQVGDALKQYILGNSIKSYSETIRETVKFIICKYPYIKKVETKYDTGNPDSNSDLLLTLQDKKQIEVNLFSIKGKSKIQAKNLGAKSFLMKYFNTMDLQDKFNTFLEEKHTLYFKSIIETREKVNVYDRATDLRKKVTALYPKFVAEIEPYRKSFLFLLREYCFQLLKDEFNEGKDGLLKAFNEFLMIDSINIITRHDGENKCLIVEEWKSIIDENDKIGIYKKGNSTIGIRIGSIAITIRFKLESSPSSSIKLATSYDQFPIETEIEKSNIQSIQHFEEFINMHQQTEEGNISNAVGKCNEAMTYYHILKRNPKINQVDSSEYQKMLIKYSSIVPHQTLLMIQTASESTERVIREYLQERYQTYEIESIQLIPESYIEDRLDTRDILLILRINDQYVEEGFSLKALAKNNVKITTKNPGAGQILGPKYFNCGYLDEVLTDTEAAFKGNKINHTQALEIVSNAIGENLLNTTQENLKKGILSLLGYAPTIITVYSINKSKIIQHGEVNGEVKVSPKTPTAIQTTLQWDNNGDELSIRVKFSSGQHKGWSSLKLACEYRFEV